MSDIVERLRNELGWGIGPAMLCQEAAEEIARLTRERDEAWVEVERLRVDISELRTHLTLSEERENKLREALRGVVEWRENMQVYAGGGAVLNSEFIAARKVLDGKP